MTALAAFASLCAFAQSPTEVFEKAPPEIDAALRARVAKFFQAHVDGKFRQAEVVVHEDNRDDFYNAEKQRLIGFEIVSISYSEKYTRATVITNVELDWHTARMGKIRVKPPMKTLWKYDAGEWWWYVIPKKEWETPFGVMHPGADPSARTPAQPKYTIPDAQTLLNQVHVSKTDIQLHSSEKSGDDAAIENGMPGDLTLTLDDPHIDGLTVTIDKPVLHAKETAHVRFQYLPPDASLKTTKTVVVRASPTAQVYTFTLTFAVPPELQKYVPKKAGVTKPPGI